MRARRLRGRQGSTDATLAAIASRCQPPPGRRLRLDDESWRKLVRDEAKLPAYLGVVLFQRSAEAGLLADVQTALLLAACELPACRAHTHLSPPPLLPAPRVPMRTASVGAFHRHGRSTSADASSGGRGASSTAWEGAWEGHDEAAPSPPLSPRQRYVLAPALSSSGRRYPTSAAEAAQRRAKQRHTSAVRTALLSGAITVIDFLRLWPPALHDACRMDKLTALLVPPLESALLSLALASRVRERLALRRSQRAAAAAAGVRGDVSRAAVAAAAADTAVALAAAHAERKDLGRQLLALGVMTVPQPPRLVASSPRIAHAHRVAAEELLPIVEALVERHPALESLRAPSEALRRGRYTLGVVAAVLASIPGGSSLEGAPLGEVRASSLADR